MRFIQQLFSPLLVILFVCLTTGCEAQPVTSAEAKPPSSTRQYNIYISAAFNPQTGTAKVEWHVPQSRWLKKLNFNVSNVNLFKVDGNGVVKQTADRLIWALPKADARLVYTVKINNIRSQGHFDAYLTNDWTILRTEDILPPVRITKIKRSSSETWFSVTGPPSWSSVNTAWLRKEGQFWSPLNTDVQIPTGWMIAGDLGTRHEELNGTRLTISAPKGEGLRQMETLAFLTAVWPQFAKVFKADVRKVLIVGAGDPMWRGGLSGPASLFVHTDRPLISENGTSTLLHELVHSASNLKGAKGFDWITEGLAEYYSVDILYQSGFYTAERRQEIMKDIEDWGDSTKDKSLHGANSKAEATARAVIVFNRLNEELKRTSSGKLTLMDLIHHAPDLNSLTLSDLVESYQTLTGKKSKILTIIDSTGH